MNALPPPAPPVAPAGWYPDPATGGFRYFDGQSWVSGGLVPGGDRPEPHPDLPLPVALGALAILAVSLVVGKAVLDSLVDREWPLVAYIALSAALSYGPSVGWLFYVRRRWGAGRFATAGWRFRWVDLGWGPLTWVSAVGVQIALAFAIVVFDIPIVGNADAISGSDADRAYYVATALAAVVAAPVIEELVFRGLVLRGLLSRMGAVPAIALQGALFGSAHADPARGSGNIGLVIVLSGVGCALGTSAYLTRRLGPSVIAHAIFNGVVVTILFTGVLDGLETGAGSAELEVVDEAHVAEPGRGEDRDRAVDAVDAVERVDVDQLHVLE